MPKSARRKLTPPQIAEQFGISTDKVLAWIKSGELRAINAATRAGGRPRWLIDVADLEAFEQRRTVTTVQAEPKRRRKAEGVIEFF